MSSQRIGWLMQVLVWERLAGSMAFRLAGSISSRLAVLKATGKFTQLFGHRALRLHPLKGNRAGQYAMTLTGNYRLIIEKVQEDRVRILDVEDYHGD